MYPLQNKMVQRETDEVKQSYFARDVCILSKIAFRKSKGNTS